jgi:hypothetical protein
MLFVLDKSDIAGLGLGQSAGIRDGEVGIAEDFTSHPFGQGPDCDGHGAPLFLQATEPNPVSLRKLTETRDPTQDQPLRLLQPEYRQIGGFG